jgi:hypothetical protein
MSNLLSKEIFECLVLRMKEHGVANQTIRAILKDTYLNLGANKSLANGLVAVYAEMK